MSTKGKGAKPLSAKKNFKEREKLLKFMKKYYICMNNEEKKLHFCSFCLRSKGEGAKGLSGHFR